MPNARPTEAALLRAWRASRGRHGWTVSEAAAYWGVMPATYARWEGKRGPPAWVIREEHGRRAHDAGLLTPPPA